MTLIPQFRADYDEYPELRTLAPEAMSRIAELMGIHGIAELRRLHKVGIFDHPYEKDIIVPIDIPTLPVAVQACRPTAGKALLDYLEAIGLTGLKLQNFTKEDGVALTSLWAPKDKQAPACAIPKKPAGPAQEHTDAPAPEDQPEQPTKEEAPDQPERAETAENGTTKKGDMTCSRE